VSLIDDALKRAQEASRTQGEPDKARPWTPPPLPDAGLARRRAILRALGIAAGGIAGLAVLGLLGWVIWNAAASEKTAAAATPAPRVAAAVPTPEPTLAETVVAPPVRARAAAVAAPSPHPTQAPASTGANASPEPKPAAAAPAQPRGLSDGKTYIRVVELPEGGRIELGGIVWSEEEPRALLNDRITAVDGYVEGFTVSKIDENRVVLTRDGMTIYLAVK
jgi:hypothetical protein